MQDSETRELRGIKGLELRAKGGENGLPTITGYAAVFDSWSETLPAFGGTFREKIAPGAFDTVLSRNSPDIRALTEHNTSNVLGRTPNSLRLETDDKGLRVEIDPPATQLGRDTVELVKRGDVDGMSFAFTVPQGGAEWSEDGSERTVTEVADLIEVSIVSFPAYQQTVAAVTRSQSEKLHQQAQAMELERLGTKFPKRDA